MGINWNTVLELLIVGLILAAAAGAGRLAFGDWEVFRRAFRRLSFAALLLFLLATSAVSVWHMIERPNVYAEIYRAAEQGTLPPAVMKAIEDEKAFRLQGMWIPLLFPAAWLYLAVLFLVARPILTAEQKRLKAIESNKWTVRYLERKMRTVQDELRELEAAGQQEPKTDT